MILSFLFYMISSITPIWASENAKIIHLCEDVVATIRVLPRGTVLDFPANPENVVLGAKGSFAIQYIRNDLAISPATLSSRSNLFVYLQGRRFSLDLETSPNGAALYFIKDCQERKVLRKKNGR